jgi:hypothetical protein
MHRERKVNREAEHARIETEISHILAGEDELLPSSGFAASVMDRVRQEAALPAPLPFPWMRAIPILLLACGGIGWSTVELTRIGMSGFGQFWLGLIAQSRWTLTLPPLSVVQMRSLEQAGWVALALGMSLVSWLISRRLAGRGGLL